MATNRSVEEMYLLIGSLTSEFRRIIGIIKNCRLSVSPWWKNQTERNNVFLSSCQTFRLSCSRLVELINDIPKGSPFHKYTFPTPGNNGEDEPLIRMMKRETGEFLIISEEFIVESVAYIQSTSSFCQLLEEKYNLGISRITPIQQALDALCAALGISSKPIPTATPVPISATPQPKGQHMNTAAPPVDIDNILASIEAAETSLSEPTHDVSYIEPIDYVAIVHEEVMIETKAEDPSLPMDSLVSDIDAIVTSIMPNTLPQTKGRSIMRGSNRDSPRGSPRGMRRGRGARRGLPVGQRRGRGGPMGSIQKGSPVPNVQEMKKIEKLLQDLAEELQKILFLTDIANPDGCQMATKFVPKAKTLLTETTKLEEKLMGKRARRMAVLLRKQALAYLHKCKDLFLTDLSVSDKKEVITLKQEFYQVLAKATSTEQVEDRASTFSVAKSSDYVPLDIPKSKPKRSNTSFTGDRPVQRSTTFAAARVPGKAPSFKGGLGSRATFVQSRKNTVTCPPPLSRADQRKRAVEEIFQSEKVFLNTLQRLIWMYKKPLQEVKESIMSQLEVKQIFSNIESIFQFNKKLIRDLERTKTKPDQSIGGVFIENAPMLRLYSEYINNFEISSNTLLQCRSKAALKSMIEDFNTLANGGTMDLSAYLIQPVQRLPRYEMLLGAIIKLTDDEHPEKEELIIAKDKIKAVNDEVNESKRQAEKSSAVVVINQKLQEKPPHLKILTGRKLEKEFTVQRMEHTKSHKTEERKIYFFTDAILIAKVRGVYPSAYTLKYKFFFTPRFYLEISLAEEVPCGLQFFQQETDSRIEEQWIFDTEEKRNLAFTLLEEMRDRGSSKIVY